MRTISIFGFILALVFCFVIVLALKGGSWGDVESAVDQSAGDQGATELAVSGGEISTFGTYISPCGSYQLEIFRGDGTLVDYKIKDFYSDKIYTPQHLFSDDKKWLFVWDEQGRLWVDSSDIGTNIWFLEEDGTLVEQALGEFPSPNFVSSMPMCVWDNMPTSLQLRWGALRMQSRSDLY
jgi:hypothetical protein